MADSDEEAVNVNGLLSAQVSSGGEERSDEGGRRPPLRRVSQGAAFGLPGDGQQARAVDIRRKMVGQRVQGFLDRRVMADIARRRPKTGKEGAAKGVLAEHPVKVAAHHPAIGAQGTFGLAIHRKEGMRPVWSFGSAKMDLVTLDHGAGGGVQGGRLGHALVSGHGGGEGQQAQTGNKAGLALDPVGVGNRGAKHLIATAEAQDLCPPAHRGGKVDVPTFGAEMREVGDGGLAAGQDDQVGLDRKGLAGFDDP